MAALLPHRRSRQVPRDDTAEIILIAALKLAILAQGTVNGLDRFPDLPGLLHRLRVAVRGFRTPAIEMLVLCDLHRALDLRHVQGDIVPAIGERYRDIGLAA